MNATVAAQAPALDKNTRTSGLLFLLTLAFVLIFYNGRFGSVDGYVIYQLTSSLAESGSVEIPASTWSSQGLNGRSYSKYGPLQSALAIPFYLVGRTVAAHAPTFVHKEYVKIAVVALFNPVVTAFLSVAVFSFALELGCSRRRSVLAALVGVFCTASLYYSKTFWTEPLTALLVTLAATQFVRALHSERAQPFFLLGCILGLAYFTRPPTLLFMVAAFALFLLAGKRSLRDLLLFAAPCVLAVVLHGAYNFYRFGSFMEFGYSTSGMPQPIQPWVGALGLLVSPQVGTIFYSPILFLSPLGLWRLYRHGRCYEALMIAAWAGALFVLISCIRSFDGHGWGARYLVPVFPLLGVAVAIALPTPQTRRGAAALAVFLGLNFLLQLPPLLVTTARVEYRNLIMLRQEFGLDGGGIGRSILQWNPTYMPLLHQVLYVSELLTSPPPDVTREDLVSDAGDSTKYSADRLHLNQAVLDRADMHIFDSWCAYALIVGIPVASVGAVLFALVFACGTCSWVLWKYLQPATIPYGEADDAE